MSFKTPLGIRDVLKNLRKLHVKPDISTVSDKIHWDALPKGTFLTFWRLQKAKIKLPLSLPPPLPHSVPTMLCSCSSYNRGQKCWGLSSDFIKTSELPLLHQTTLNLEWKGWKWALLGEGSGGWGDETKADQNTDCNGSESYVTISCIAGFYHSVLSFDLHYQYLQKTTNTPTLSRGVGKGVQIVYFSEVTSAPFLDIVLTMFRAL